MTDAGWTSRKPTEAGWYWFRRVGTVKVVEIIAVPDYEPKYWIVEGVNLRWSLGNMDGDWLGPISPSTYHQGRVAGLREAKTTLERLEDRYTALETDVEDFYRWVDSYIERQAQGGKS